MDQSNYQDYAELVRLEAKLIRIIERYENTSHISREVIKGMNTLAGDLMYEYRTSDGLKGNQEDIFYAKAHDSVRPLSPSELKATFGKPF